MTSSIVQPDPSVDYSSLWQPLAVGPVVIKNRIALSAMTLGWGQLNNVFSDRHLDYYEERARGGVGLIITEQNTASRDRVEHLATSVSALRPESVDRYRALAERVRPHDTKVFVQLYGPGSQERSGNDLDHWGPVWAPSPMPSGAHGEVPHALTSNDIRHMVDNFAKSAEHVQQGGLDGIEIHGSHGWLLHRFLSPMFNHRTDEYGGSAANRCRAVLQLAEAIRDKVGRELALGVQLSTDDYFGDGTMTTDLMLEQLTIIAGAGLFDYVNLSTGNEFTDDETIPPVEFTRVPTERAGELAVALCRDVADGGEALIVMVQGGVQNTATAARIVSAQHADFVGMARPLLADPHLVRKTREGLLDQIMPCVGVGECFWRNLDFMPTVCVHNPVTGREGVWGLDNRGPADVPAKRVAVIGAGPAGLEAAATAAERGHDVTVFERSDRVGGHLLLEAALPHRQRWNDTIDAFQQRAEGAGAKVELNTEITEDSELLTGFDVVLVATGSSWDDDVFHPSLPLVKRMPRDVDSTVLGMDEAVVRAVADPTSLGGSVVIVDEYGDYLALGLADLVSESGAKVRVVTRRDAVGAHLRVVVDTLVFDRLKTRDVELMPQTVLTGFHDAVVTMNTGTFGRETTVEDVDTVVAGTVRRSVRELYEELAQRYDGVRLIGDALVPRRMPEALADAHDAAFDI